MIIYHTSRLDMSTVTGCLEAHPCSGYLTLAFTERPNVTPPLCVFSRFKVAVFASIIRHASFVSSLGNLFEDILA